MLESPSHLYVITHVMKSHIDHFCNLPPNITEDNRNIHKNQGRMENQDFVDFHVVEVLDKCTL